MALTFHSRCGDRVILVNNNRTAIRDFTVFNNGIVLSSQPLADYQMFQVHIDKKINAWSGTIEIGVTCLNPETMEFPRCASELRGGTWILSGTSVLKDGQSIVEEYGMDLEKLFLGDYVGVMRTSEGELVFYVNGESQGVAARDIPCNVYAFVDLYGKCAQVTIVPEYPERSESEVDLSSSCRVDDPVDETQQPALVADLVVSMNVANDQANGVAFEDSSPLSSIITNNNNSNNNNNNELEQRVSYQPERIWFHDRCGSMVRLSCGGRSAERKRPLDEFNNGVVMTNRPLKDDELFEIRIDRLVDKWSGSIEVGVTTHSPTALKFPATMTNLQTGTTMMSGNGILTNGKGTRRQYGEFNLDELLEGDRIGMMRKSNGDLHFFINGLDQGVAANVVPPVVWGVVDLYGMTVKVSIVDRDEREEQNLITRRNRTQRLQSALHSLNDFPEEENVDQCVSDFPEEDNPDRLMFHPNCGISAEVINNNRTAHRPRATDYFNHAVVLTNRPLHPGELFEVRLDKMVTNWAGSIEIGVTMHSPTELEFPSTMTNVRSGTWVMTGNGVMHNGSTAVQKYGHNLDSLTLGDRVGVMRTEQGTLHFFVNGVDQGVAASGMPEQLYGVIDLYGQAVQVTIVDSERDRMCRSISDTTISTANHTNIVSGSGTATYSDLRFGHSHGKNVRLSNARMTASRPRAFGEFKDAIVVSNRPLRDNEIFEVVVEKTVGCWLGSIEAGVTSVRSDDLELPCILRDLKHGTWILSGSSVMVHGSVLKKNYPCNLDEVVVGNRVGLSRHSDSTLHFYLDGEDLGVACHNVPSGVFAVIDLYGQCAQVSIVPPALLPGASVRGARGGLALPDRPLQFTTETTPTTLGGGNVSETFPPSSQTAIPANSCHRFGAVSGKNVVLQSGGLVATRLRGYSHALAFSANPLEPDETFEICLREMAPQWSGTVRLGVTVTTPALPGGTPAGFPPDAVLPPALPSLTADTWYLIRDEVQKNGRTLRRCYCPNLEWLTVGDCVGVRRAPDGSLSFSLNGEDMGVAIPYVPKKVYAVVDLYGKVVTVGVTSIGGPAAVMPIGLLPLAAPEMASSLTGGATGNGGNDDGDDAACGGPDDSLRSSRLHDSLEMLLDTTESAPKRAPLEPTGSEGDTCDDILVSRDNGAGGAISGAALADDHSDRTKASVGVSSSNKGQLSSQQGQSDAEAESLLSFGCDRFGRNIELGPGGRVARRTASYNQGLVVSERQLARDHVFQVRIEAVDPRWVSSLLIGVTGALQPTGSPSSTPATSCVPGPVAGPSSAPTPPPPPLPQPARMAHLPVTALGLRKDTWVVCGDFVLRNGFPIRGQYGPNLDSLTVGDTVGVSVDSCNRLHLWVNGVDQGIAAQDIPPRVHALVDVYGQCQQVRIVGGPGESATPDEAPALPLGTEDDDGVDVAMPSDHSPCGGLASCHLQSATVCVSDIYIDEDDDREGLSEKADLECDEKEKLEALVDASEKKIIGMEKQQAAVMGVKDPPSQPASPPRSLPATLSDNDVANGHLKQQLLLHGSAPLITAAVAAKKSVPPSPVSDNSLSLPHQQSKVISQVSAGSGSRRATPASTPGGAGLDSWAAGTPPAHVNNLAGYVQSTTCGRLSGTVTQNISAPARKCEYQSICSRFRVLLGLPDGFFLSDNSGACFCDQCVRKLRPPSPPPGLAVRRKSAVPVATAATPTMISHPAAPPSLSAQQFSGSLAAIESNTMGAIAEAMLPHPTEILPEVVGWCRFPLRRRPKPNTQESSESIAHSLQPGNGWHVAFWGARLGDVRQVLDRGELLLPGELSLQRMCDKSESEGSQLVLSPDIRHAVSKTLPCRKKAEFVDPKTRRRYRAWAAFQVLVQPGTYKVSKAPAPGVVGEEWVTKERGTTLLSALLLRLRPADDDAPPPVSVDCRG